jgi:cytochrome c biogenesis protein CcmG, thiol:disulfide interchange protein DsbE
MPGRATLAPTYPLSKHDVVMKPLLAMLTLAVTLGCEVQREVEVGRRVPDFSASSLKGQAVSLAELRGEVVLLNVWATWCFPCRREMPSFEALYREHGRDGLRIVGVSIDGAGAERDVKEFLHEYGITFDILLDPGQRITRTFRTTGVPETFLIGRDGVLVKHWIGRIDGHSEGIRAPIRDALGFSLAPGGLGPGAVPLMGISSATISDGR